MSPVRKALTLSELDLTLFAPLVKKLRVRSGLDTVDVDMLLSLPRRIKQVESGKYLVRQGDIAEYCSLILSGFACKTKTSGTGERQIVSINMQGDIIDLHNCFLEEADHNVQALSFSTVALIPKYEIVALIDERVAIRKALLLDILIDASICREWLLNVGQRNGLQRVAHLICELAIRQDLIRVSDDDTYELPLTQEQFGDAIGLTAVHVNRMLRTLRHDGIIQATKQTITVKSWGRLLEVADFNRQYLHVPENYRSGGGEY